MILILTLKQKNHALQIQELVYICRFKKNNHHEKVFVDHPILPHSDIGTRG